MSSATAYKKNKDGLNHNEAISRETCTYCMRPMRTGTSQLSSLGLKPNKTAVQYDHRSKAVFLLWILYVIYVSRLSLL